MSTPAQEKLASLLTGISAIPITPFNDEARSTSTNCRRLSGG